MRHSSDLALEYGRRFDGPIPAEFLAEIEAVQREEREAAEIARLMLLPPDQRFAALARREWGAMRVIWRAGNYHDFQKIMRRGDPEWAAHPQVMTKARHLWREARALTVPHLIAWQAFRDAHRKMQEAA